MNPYDGSPVDWTPYHVRQARREARARQAVAAILSAEAYSRAVARALLGALPPTKRGIRPVPGARLRHYGRLLSRLNGEV